MSVGVPRTRYCSCPSLASASTASRGRPLFEFSRDSVNVEANRLRKFEQYLSAADVATLGEKRTSDTQVEVQERGLALLRGTPRDLKGRERRGRPVVSKERGEVCQRLLDRGEPPLLAKDRARRRLAAHHF